MQAAFSHFGICVGDLDASVRFYTGAFGFEVAELHQIGDEFAALMELENVTLRSQFLRRDGVTMELLAFEDPAPVGEPARRPINKLGLTHLSFRVDDVAAAAALVEQFGGRVHRSTRTTFGPDLDFVYCTDPNGVRIELMKLPGPPPT
jgi:catechol 2,3-dioxygenase-like lactoylglutathione lyase family enzyme